RSCGTHGSRGDEQRENAGEYAPRFLLDKHECDSSCQCDRTRGAALQPPCRGSSAATIIAVLQSPHLTNAPEKPASRDRIMYAAKTLFARLGYEQTATAAIAREAGSSESQLMRYFGGKAGLLEAIFNESWTAVIVRVNERIPPATPAHDALLGIFRITMRAFGGEPQLAALVPVEG